MAKTKYHYDHIAGLIRAYQTGELDAASQAELDAWRSADAANQELFEELNQPTRLSHALKEMNQFDAAARLAEFEHKHLDKPAVKLWPKIAITAAAVAAITLSMWLYDISKTPRHPDAGQDPNAVAIKNDIAPGKNTATLTLSSGEVIHLDTNKNSVIVTDSVKTMVMLTASTPSGGTYQLTLPDGTHVWLNADSKITFPSQFVGQQRRISLEGEASFAVSHDQSKPFIVKTDQQEVAVLGTEFNINAYGDNNETRTTLVKGSVQVHAGQLTLLKPGQQSILANGQLNVQQADIESAIGWKNGIFLFYNTDLKSIMRQLARWYNLDVDLSTMPDNRFYGEISRDVKLSEVLTMLEATGNIKFKIEERRVMLQK